MAGQHHMIGQLVLLCQGEKRLWWLRIEDETQCIRMNINIQNDATTVNRYVLLARFMIDNAYDRLHDQIYGLKTQVTFS